MSKIAIIGAPGSGKTVVARRLARRLNAGSPSWTVIDGYMDKLKARTGLDFGPDQSMWAFRYHVQVLGERWTLEDEVAHKGLSSITCGSIFESIIYAAAQGMIVPALGDEQLMLEETNISRIMMNALGVLVPRTFDYDALLYLPLEASDHDWHSVVDAKIPEVLEGQFKVAIPLTGTLKQKVDRAEEVVKICTSSADDGKPAVR